MRCLKTFALSLLGSIVFGFCTSHSGHTLPSGSQPRLIRVEKPDLTGISLTDFTTTGSRGILEPAITADGDEKEVKEADSLYNLQKKLAVLNHGRSILLAVDGYTGIFRKQELVDGVLLEEQTIELKCRHRPFSVYLNWLTGDTGREVIYIEGQNNGKMIAHDGGWKARIPALTLPTDCMLAMRDARYPVTTAGLVGLIDIMRSVHEQDLLKSNLASCEIDEHRQFDGRPCTMYTTRYKSRSESTDYRKSITLIDHEWKVPVHTEHFGWLSNDSSLDEKKLDEFTLIESYSFTSLDFHCQLTDHDFDRKNPEYRFR